MHRRRRWSGNRLPPPISRLSPAVHCNEQEKSHTNRSTRSHELFEVIADLYPDAGGFDDVIVRNVGAKYANKNSFYSGVGAAAVGGRWNPKGLEAIYASLDVETATLEAYQDFIYRGFSMTAITPRVTAAAKVELSKTLDLTDSKIRKKLGFDQKTLIQEDWRALQRVGEESWTQAIGRGSCIAKFEALIVASARKIDGKNIVIFPQNLSNTSKIDILGSDQLPT